MIFLLLLFLYDVDYCNAQLAKWANKQIRLQTGKTIDDHRSVIDSHFSTRFTNKGIIQIITGKFLLKNCYENSTHVR